MNINKRHDIPIHFFELQVNVPRTIGILRHVVRNILNKIVTDLLWDPFSQFDSFSF